VAIGCGGLLFSLYSKMIKHYFICHHCNESFTKKVQFQHHIHQENHDIDIEKCNKYKNILLIPGMGHIDINNTKALFKLMWQPCIKNLAILLGWKSPKALTLCEHCTDHHKAMQILDILFESLTSELLKAFVKYCNEKKQQPDVINLYAFAKIQPKHYQFLL